MDAVIITASTKDNGPVETAGAMARKNGNVVVVGALGMNLPREPYYKKELELRLSMSYGPGRYDSQYEEHGRDYPFGYVRWTEQRNMQTFLELVAERKVRITPLITHRFSIEQAEAAYALMTEGTTPYQGMVITYPEDHTRSLPRTVAVAEGQSNGAITLGIIGAGNHVSETAPSARSSIRPRVTPGFRKSGSKPMPTASRSRWMISGRRSCTKRTVRASSKPPSGKRGFRRR